MKQATSNLNATVIVVLAVGVLMAFFYYTIWPMIRVNFEKYSSCSRAICEPCNKEGSNGKKMCDFVTCHDANNPDVTFECVWKG